MSTAELEQRAERAVRRGELLAAIELFEAYLAQEPDDDRIRSRMEAVRALLQPSELVNRRRTEPEETVPAAPPVTDTEAGEIHASSGRFLEAAEAYERAVSANPENELLQERLRELRGLSNPAGKADLDAAERLEAPQGPQTNPVVRAGARSARAHAASFAPLQADPARPLPREPKALLEELLERVRSGRR
jgi:tetratricopeptide (TPR) repeat protein